MSVDFVEHLPPSLQFFCWMAIGAAIALWATVYKWIWRGLGHLWSQTFGPPSLHDYPVWRAPEPPAGPIPAPPADRAVGEKLIEGGGPARK